MKSLANSYVIHLRSFKLSPMVAKIRNLLSEKGLDGFLVTNLINVRYLTGFTGSNGQVLITRDAAIFMTDFRYKIQSRQEVREGFEIVVYGSYMDELKKLVSEYGIKTLGVEGNHVTVVSFNNMKEKLEGVELVPLDGVVEDLRIIKSPEELELLRKSQEINHRLFWEIMNFIEPGKMTERDVAIEIEYLAKKLGADDVSFRPIVASGPHSALPHASPRDVVIAPNDVLLLDFGVFYRGYASDMTRTVWVGSRPTEDFLEIYNIVLEAQEMVEERARVGMTNREVDAIARDYIRENGFGENFGHGLGHGIGLEIHEAPYFSHRASEYVLKGGEVFTVEPGIYLEGKFGVRIEDMVYADASSGGLEIITRTTKNINELKIE